MVDMIDMIDVVGMIGMIDVEPWKGRLEIADDLLNGGVVVYYGVLLLWRLRLGLELRLW